MNQTPVTPPVDPVVPPVQSAPADPVTATPPPTDPKPAGNKMIMWLVIGLVALALVVGGFYLYSRQTGKSAPQTVSQSTQELDGLEIDIKAVEADSTDSLTEIDQDLQSL